MRPGARMKQALPVHFVAGLFQAIAPDAQRMRREIERCGILGMPHAAEVHRFDMHAPERLKRNRTVVRAHAVAITSRPLLSASSYVPAFSGAISADLPYACADPPRSADDAPIASTSPSKDRVGGNSPQRLDARADTRSQHVRTTTGCRPLPRNGEAPSEILQCCRRTREPEMEREQNIRTMCRTRTVARYEYTSQ